MISLRKMEIAIADMFDIRRHIIVPNLSWGFGTHECDLFIVRESGYAVEVEIKRSVADFLNDFEKKHSHKDTRIKELYYAFPEELLNSCKDKVPEKCGIISVYELRGKVYARIVRKAQSIETHRILTTEEISKVMRLGCMRIWRLKQLLDRIDNLKDAK